MLMTKSVQSFLRSLGKSKLGFEKTMVARNKYLLSNDPHYCTLKNITFTKREDNIASHDVEQYVFFVTIHSGKVYYLSVSTKESMTEGLKEAKFAYDVLHKYNPDGFHPL